MRRLIPLSPALALVFVLASFTSRAAEPPAAGAKPLTPEQQERLRERDRHEAEARKLGEVGRLAKMVAAWEKKVAIEREVYGDVHEQIAASLAYLASVHEFREDFAAARKARRDVLAIRRKLHGEGDWRVGDAERGLADTDRLAGMDAAQRRQLRAARRSNEQVVQLHRQGKYAEALPFALWGLAVHERLLGEKHPAYANSLVNLAALYKGMGDFQRARPLSERAFQLSKEVLGEKHPDYADSLNRLAQLYQEMGDYRQARPLFERARDLAKRWRGENHPEYARSLNNLAALYQDMGDYGQTRSLYERALRLFKEVRGEKDPNDATGLNNLAGLYLTMGDYGRARPLFERARDTYKEAVGEKHPAYARSLNNLAGLYQELGDYGRARTLFERALQLRREALGERHPEYAQGLNNLAMIYRDMGNHGKAESLYRQALEIKKHAVGQGHPAYATSLLNLALLYQGMGDFQRARPLLEQARDTYKEAVGEKHPHYARSLNNLGTLYLAMGEYGRAQTLYERARDLRKRTLGEGHPHYAESLFNLAALHIAKNQYAQAVPLSTEALGRQRAFLDMTFGTLSGRQRLDFLQQHQAHLHIYLAIACETGIPAAQSYPHVLAWKGAVAARHAEERLAFDQPDLQPLLDELRERRAGLARLTRLTPATPEQQADWRRRFDGLERRKEELETQLAGHSDAFRQYRDLRKATARQVADALPPQTALVDFLEYAHCGPPPGRKDKLKSERRLLAFVLARGREPVCLQLGAAGPVEKAVRDWRRPLESSPPGRLDDRAAQELLRRVWRPLEKHLGDASVVLLAPDGALTALPFAALPGRRPGSFLLEEIAIGCVTSGRQLLELAAGARRPAHGLLALGGLAYGGAPDPGALARLPNKAALPELPGTRLEIEAVERAFRRVRPGARVTVLKGEGVDAARLQRELPAGSDRAGYRYLHLATHGFFEPPPENTVTRRLPGGLLGAEYRTFVRNPMLLSGLLLAGANRDPAKAVLTAEEVSGLDLRGAEMVVLSACDTGLGRVTRTEGVLGLRRGFHEAGARSLAVSLWGVSDAATSVLMEEFYRNLWEKRMSRLEALRRAQLTVLRNPGLVEARAKELSRALAKRGLGGGLRGGSRKPVRLPDGGRVREGRRSHPAYWAAFVLSGDPGPIPPAPQDKARGKQQPGR